MSGSAPINATTSRFLIGHAHLVPGPTYTISGLSAASDFCTRRGRRKPSPALITSTPMAEITLREANSFRAFSSGHGTNIESLELRKRFLSIRQRRTSCAHPRASRSSQRAADFICSVSVAFLESAGRRDRHSPTSVAFVGLRRHHRLAGSYGPKLVTA